MYWPSGMLGQHHHIRGQVGHQKVHSFTGCPALSLLTSPFCVPVIRGAHESVLRATVANGRIYCTYLIDPLTLSEHPVSIRPGVNFFPSTPLPQPLGN